MKAVSLFSSAGISELYLREMGIDVFLAQELLEERVNFYKSIYNTNSVVCGDIRDKRVYDDFISKSKMYSVDLLMATPPCQGLSTAGKCNWKDERNELFLYVISAIIDIKPRYVFMENVPSFIKSKIMYNDKPTKIIDIISLKLSANYHIEYDVVNSSSFGVPQSRRRALILMTRKDQNKRFTLNKTKFDKKTVEDAIGNLPSIEAKTSRVQNNGKFDWSNKHFSPIHNERHISWMKNTPTGCTAFDNVDEFKPRKINGDLIKGFKSTYKRMEWNKPAPTVTMMNGAISSQNNVHPGRLNENGEYSDARVLTVLELMRISSIPDDWNIPEWCSESFIRKIIGEGIPPLMTKRILEVIL